MVIVSMGARGTLLVKKGEQEAYFFDPKVYGWSTPQEEIETTVGCGDANTAGHFEVLLRGGSPNEILRRGAELAREALSCVGGFNKELLTEEGRQKVLAPGTKKLVVNGS